MVQLEQVAKDLRERGWRDKFDAKSALEEIKQGRLLPLPPATPIVLDGHKITIQFTCDLLPSQKIFWHLSMKVHEEEVFPPDAKKAIVHAFFGNRQCMDLPSLLNGPSMVHVLSLLDEAEIIGAN